MRLTADVVPALAVLLDAVGILHQVVVRIVECGEADGEVTLLAVVDGQHLSVQDGVCLLVALKLIGRIDDMRSEAALPHLLRREA